jgi:nitrate reductase gamma subunit
MGQMTRKPNLLSFRTLPALAGPAMLFLMPAAAHAYVGPGAGLTAIGSVVALFAAVGLALVGFVWYPLKRLFKRKAAATPAEELAAGDHQK